MGRGRARRKGQGRKAYLKSWPSGGMAAWHPNRLGSRNNGAINIAAVVRDSETGQLIEVQYNSTQMHGKRGLTLLRATGPTAVAPHFEGTAPTMIPRVEAQLKRMQLENKQGKAETPLRQRVTVAGEDWQGLRRQGFTEFHRIVLQEFRGKDKKVWYSMELFFSGTRFFFIEENLRSLWQSISIEYSSHKRAMDAFDIYQRDPNRGITWKDSVPLPPPKPPSSD